MSRWTIYKQIGEEDDAIEGPDTPPEGIVVEAPQFSPEELSLIAHLAGSTLEFSSGFVAPQTVEWVKALQTKAASLAFMEVSRDA